MLKKSRYLLFVVMIGLLFLAACGSDEAAGEEQASGENMEKEELIIAEPVHGFGYLPLYVAISKGYFESVDVSVTTLTGGSAHTNAVLTDEAWAFIGGPEHNAFAKAKGAELRAIGNVVNKGNVYLVASPDLEPSEDMTEFLTGKTVVTSQYGGTPNSITRYLLAEWGLEVGEDVTLMEVENAAIPSIISEGNGHVAVVSDPVMQQGINEGIWNEPFYNVPMELGPYAYSTINVKLDSIEENPEQVEGFMEGLVKGLDLILEDPDEALEIAKEEFSTLDPAVLEDMLDRAIEDELWEFDGKVTEDSITTNLKVVENAGMLEEEISYSDIVDPQFFE
ncbi:ABC transporter substrate-binding protein [Saliterribacillus persicus]|uniref:NitT/TauT family transport system substrate-binding protein n=1 Tax=Saliterribacillus persicus TaxID=930114 RepID=A0A368YAI0_9BACI|nr:ABC transporter substrate-binding protein [Saliterribacillus persicus]RCW77253.1 NitT/TauT family transport system substrate-binding protein [Saliterribacillus persicus]